MFSAWHASRRVVQAGACSVTHPRRRTQRTFNSPALREPLVYRGSRQARHGQPIRQAERALADRDQTGSGRIATLFRRGGPSNIAGLIVAILVNAFNGMRRRWTRADISQEGLEVAPLFTDANAAPAVPSVVLVLRIITATAHCGPHLIREGWATFSRRAVFQQSRGIQFRFQATAALRMSCRQHSSGDVALISTATPTAPHDVLSLSARGRLYDSQPTKVLAGQIVRRAMQSAYSELSQAVSSAVGAVMVRGCGSLATILSSDSVYSSLAVMA